MDLTYIFCKESELKMQKEGNLTVYSKIFLDLLTTLGYTQYSG